MEKKEKSLLTNKEFVFVLFGSVVGVGVISLPNDIAKVAYEDAWISALIGAIYPIYIVVIANSIRKKFPNENILVLSKKYLGKIIGTILNLIFEAYFIFLTGSILSAYTILTRLFVLSDTRRIIIIVVTVLIAIYGSTKGIKALGKVSVVVFYTALFIFISPVSAFKPGNIINVLPLFKSGVKSILSGALTTAFAYTGIETILIIYPELKEKDKMLQLGLKSVLIIAILYSWVTFITIVYLGTDIISKSYWSFLYVTESVTLSFVNNFRYIFMFLWALTVFKIISNSYFMAVTIAKDMLGKVSIKKVVFIIAPLVIAVALIERNVPTRTYIVERGIKLFVTYNLLYVTMIWIFTMIKKDEKSENDME